MSSKRSTMNDVAKLAGVTQATVSYVINDSANISDEVKKRVFAAIEKLNYSPNYNARALKTTSSNIIGIILPDIVNQYYSRMVEVLEELLVKSNHHTMICTTSYNPDYEKDVIQRLLSYDVQAIITLYQLTDPSNWNILKQSNKSIIALGGGSYCSNIGIPCINIDNYQGGYMATQYLLNKGHKRIAYVHQTAHNESLHSRFLGYTDAMRDANLYNPNDIFYIESANNKYEEGEKIGSQLSELAYDAIFASSDLIAVGIIRQLANHGKKIPDDVSIVGYDNVPLAELIIPSLTTVMQPTEDACRRMVEYLFPDDDNKSDEWPTLQPYMIIRESA